MPRSLRDAIAAVRVDGHHQQIRCPHHDDRQASLSIDAGKNGGVVLKCHAGCATRAVLEADGLTLADLAPDNTNGDKPTIVDVSDYRDEAGTVLYQVVRYLPKDFKQRKPDGVGGYVWSLNGVRRVLYRLPELRGPRLWCVEGEKDANRLASLGLPATTIAGGGGAKWLPDFTAQLQAANVREVVIVPDNDKTGKKFTATVQSGLKLSGIAVRVLELPGLPVKGDVSDWLDAGHSLVDLETLLVPQSSPHHVGSGVSWTVVLDVTERGPRATLANAVLVLQHDPQWRPSVLYHDDFLERTMCVEPTGPREYTDADDTRVTIAMQEENGPHMIGISESQVASAVRYVALQRRRHCVREYLDALTWDTEPRIEFAFEECWGALHSPEQPAEYVRAVSRNFFLGMVARVMRPGCQLDTMPIFEGSQGLGKSSALRLLGGAWYALGAESVTTKDFFQILPGKWIIEIGEMDSFTRGERERIKIAISTPTDRYRASYGRRAIDHPRQCVFAGTTNRDDYGNDDTGLRRFLPIQCTDILLEDIAAQRDQWFAEAVHLVRAGVSWWEVPASARAVQRSRQAEDVWTPRVLDYLVGRVEVRIVDVLTDGLKMRDADMTHTHKLRIGSILRLNGWKKSNLRRDGKQAKTWVASDDE